MVSGQLGSLLQLLNRPVRVAATGHRPNQLPEEAVARVRAALDSALDSILAAGKEAAGKNARFTLVSALAEGADRLAAEAALARGWTLEAPLPFSIERYEKDFPNQDSIDAFHTLLKQAAKVIPAPANDDKGDLGYAAVGKAVARGAEIGLIVWNGAAAKGEGGTADVAAQLLDAGAPVIWIGVAERQRSKLILPADAVARKGARATYLRAALAARFERTDRPAEIQAAAG
jgi:hypothetical protein